MKVKTCKHCGNRTIPPMVMTSTKKQAEAFDKWLRDNARKVQPVFGTWKIKDRNKSIYRKEKNSKVELPKNIYNSQTQGEDLKKAHIIHYAFKYKFFIPLLRLGKRILGKRLIREVPDRIEYEYVKIMNDSVEEAIQKWYTVYMRARDDNKHTIAYWEEASKKEEHIRSVKEFANTVICNDTAYLEFMPFMLHAIQRRMNEHNKQKHLMYTSHHIYDARYFALYPTLKNKDNELKPFKMIRVGVQKTGGTKRKWQKPVRQI